MRKPDNLSKALRNLVASGVITRPNSSKYNFDNFQEIITQLKESRGISIRNTKTMWFRIYTRILYIYKTPNPEVVKETPNPEVVKETPNPEVVKETPNPEVVKDANQATTILGTVEGGKIAESVTSNDDTQGLKGANDLGMAAAGEPQATANAATTTITENNAKSENDLCQPKIASPPTTDGAVAATP